MYALKSFIFQLQFSCISLALIKNLRLEKDVVPAHEHKKLFTANGKTMKILGTILLSVNIRGLIIHPFIHLFIHLFHSLFTFWNS